MADVIASDNDFPMNDRRPRHPDAHGQAAILLVESLIHALVARSVISVAEAVEIVDIAVDAQGAISADLDDTSASSQKSREILYAISASLALDL